MNMLSEVKRLFQPRFIEGIFHYSYMEKVERAFRRSMDGRCIKVVNTYLDSAAQVVNHT